jgi:hypothetical protein
MPSNPPRNRTLANFRLAKTAFDARIAALNPLKTHLAGKLLVILYLT